MVKHLVLGAGQVGTAIVKVLEDKYPFDVTVRDLRAPAVLSVEVMHVCFPYSSFFTEHVKEYQRMYTPELTIVHSTVPVGTSRELGAVHSPVTGKHPNLVESVKTFTKFFGGADANRAASYFDGICPVYIVPDQETTEAGKLWQTLQYGWLIAMQKEAYAYAEAFGADPKIMYDKMNKAYNEGYKKMGMDFTLPVLEDMPGKIGGHCIIPNAELIDTPLAWELISMNEEFSK